MIQNIERHSFVLQSLISLISKECLDDFSLEISSMQHFKEKLDVNN